MIDAESIDPIILGHNPFFGVDHLSQARGNEKDQRFSNVERILEIMDCCHDLGVSGMMMSTHPRSAEVAKALRGDLRRMEQWRVYPLVPYVQKYVRGSNEKGLVNLLMDTMGQAPLGKRLALALRGGSGLVRKDLQQMFKVLIDVELLPFKGLRLGGIFLHDALTDLAVGLGFDTLLDLFRDHVRDEYDVPAVLTTKNLPTLRETLDGRGWAQPWIMASFNAKGFYVNPDLTQCAKAVQEPGFSLIAMSTLASGSLHPTEAYEYLSKFRATRSVVVGMSTPEHARQTINAIREHLPWLDSRS